MCVPFSLTFTVQFVASIKQRTAEPGEDNQQRVCKQAWEQRKEDGEY
jgi:hypothetical protein